MAIQPGSEVLEDRRRILGAVETALTLLDSGQVAAAAEVEHVDFKEEAGRRARGGVVLPGLPRNTAVADQLADEVACLANTPGGGALIVGVADDGTVIGAATDRDWLRHRVNQLVDVAPAIEERTGPGGVRLLVILVAEAPEPVENRNGALRWRVGTTCAPVDRSEWWAARAARALRDPLSGRTDRTVHDIPGSALVATRRLLPEGGEPGETLRDLPPRELMTRLGVLLPDGHLTAAGVHMFCPAPRTVIELISLDVPGGDVVSRSPDLSGRSLVEQLAEIESRLDVLDKQIPVSSGLTLAPVRQVPWGAVREALLNAVVHRDWLPPEPVRMTWIEADATLQVVSPGGFAGGITSESVLSARFSRNPSLADLARAMGLVERGGVGVDRMYREMVALGHRPPSIREIAGPSVECRLAGGRPLAAVQAVVNGLEPPLRRRDYTVVLTVFALLRDGFVTAGTLGQLLQIPATDAEEVLDTVAECTVTALPAIRAGSGTVWFPGAGLVERATHDEPALAAAKRRGLVTWYRPDASGAQRLVLDYLAAAGRISSGDVAEVTGLTPAGGRALLSRLEAAGLVARGGATTRGRNAHYVASGAAPTGAATGGTP